MKVHKLKTWPKYFDAIVTGAKPFEVRWDDRRFREGDGLQLQEWDPVTGNYTNRETFRLVTYVLADTEPDVGQSLKAGYVVLGLAEPQAKAASLADTVMHDCTAGANALTLEQRVEVAKIARGEVYEVLSKVARQS